MLLTSFYAIPSFEGARWRLFCTHSQWCSIRFGFLHRPPNVVDFIFHCWIKPCYPLLASLLIEWVYLFLFWRLSMLLWLHIVHDISFIHCLRLVLIILFFTFRCFRILFRTKNTRRLLTIVIHFGQRHIISAFDLLAWLVTFELHHYQLLLCLLFWWWCRHYAGNFFIDYLTLCSLWIIKAEILLFLRYFLITLIIISVDINHLLDMLVLLLVAHSHFRYFFGC